MRWKRLIVPRMDAPFPAWRIFPVAFAALYASHFTLLRLPYYWDEAGYYIPAAWDFFRTGSLIPISTITNAHPPLPSIYLALCWKLSGFAPEVTRTSVLMVASLGLVAVWRLAMRLTGVASVAFWTVALTALYPVWFAQSTLAHADIFAAACSLWGLVYALPELGALTNQSSKPWAAAAWFAAAALCKETAIVIPLTLAAVALVESLRAPGRARIRLRHEAAWFASCAVPLAAWYAYHYSKTGFLFGNPEYLRYNAQANLSLLRIAAAFGYRILHLTAHMNLFVPVGVAIAALLLDPRPDRDQGSEIRDQRSEIGDRRSEIRDRRSEIRDQRSEIRDQRSNFDRQSRITRSSPCPILSPFFWRKGGKRRLSVAPGHRPRRHAPHPFAARGERAALQHPGRRAAAALPAAHDSAGAAARRSHHVPPRALLARAGRLLRRGLHPRPLHQSALPLRA